MSRSAMPATVPMLSAAELTARRGVRWQPGSGGACHSEIFASSGEAGGAGAALALALDEWRHAPRAEGKAGKDRRAVLWVQTREAARLGGRPYRPGLPAELRHRVIHVLAVKPEDALFALEEGTRCRDIAFVIGEITGNPRALDFTASRRLTLSAQRHGVPLYLVRIDAMRDLSSARMRWEMCSAPSAPPKWNAQAPGGSAWHARLFRARGHAPGEWMLHEQAGLVASPPSAAIAPPPAGGHAAEQRSLARSDARLSARPEQPRPQPHAPRRALSSFN